MYIYIYLWRHFYQLHFILLFMFPLFHTISSFSFSVFTSRLLHACKPGTNISFVSMLLKTYLLLNRDWKRRTKRCWLLCYRQFSAKWITNAIDRQRVNAFLNRSIRCGFCPPDLRSFEELCQAADVQLFDAILVNTNQLHSLLPPPSFSLHNYNLRLRTHNRQLILHTGNLTDCNFF